MRAKIKLREGTCYCCGKPGHIFPECTATESTPKDKWEFKTATQNVCAESQKAESQSGNKKTQSTKDEEDNMLEVISCTTENQNFIQSQILFTHKLINIVGVYIATPTKKTTA